MEKLLKFFQQKYRKEIIIYFIISFAFFIYH